jgi:hypothetical protein
MLSKTPYKETIDSLSISSSLATTTYLKVSKSLLNFSPLSFILKIAMPSEGSYNTFNLYYFSFLIANKYSIV